jgi:formylglycine-generating enzyme required for sulfatase activity
MKTRKTLFVLFVLILAACAPVATVTSTEPPVVTQTAKATEPAISAVPTSVPTTAPSLQVGDTYLYVDGTNLVAVPAGEFTMGGNGNDNPGHSVTLRDYWIYSTKVTNQQYALCMQVGNCTPPDLTDNPGYPEIQHANDPVTGVTYDQAAAYCSYIGGHLPTEAEWEKAADNPQGGEYPWGDGQPTCDLANFAGCGEGATNVINFSGGASYYGALDMVGNAFEWVSDWYDANYYQNSPADDPSGPENGTSRVVRSSGFDSTPDQLATTNRNSEDPNAHRSNLGFRCVVDQPAQFAPLCEAPLLYDTQTGTSTCPTLEVKQVELCAQNFPYTTVSVDGAPDAKINSEGCVPTGDPATVSCQPPSTVSAEAQCQVDISGNPTCPIGYSLQGNTCVADGAQGGCPTGLSFDSSKQCCGLPAGSDMALQALVCPVGTFYVAGQNACMPNPVQELVTVSVEVGFKSCAARPGGGDGNGNGNDSTTTCQPPPEGCFSSIWSPTLCCCSPDGSSC